MDKRKKYRDDDDDDDDFFSRFFTEDFEEEIERIRKHIEKMIKEFAAGIDLEDVRHKVLGPFVYGFSMKIGPDGKPMIREFGNTKKGPWLEEQKREPLTDIIEEKNNICITMELPGVEKEDIDLKVTENEVTISVDTPKRKYHKEVSLPSEVIPESTKATYKNGILDIVMEKVVKKPPKKEGRKINIE